MEKKLYHYIEKLQKVKHYKEHYQNLLDARDYITNTLWRFSLEVNSEPFYVTGFDKPFHNIECEMGTNKELPVLFLASHYDTVPTSPGANDNASGVAAMLCLAEALKNWEDKVHLVFLFFTLEERNPNLQGEYINDPLKFGETALIGSMKWVNENIAKYKNVLGVIDMDSIGCASNEVNSHRFNGMVVDESMEQYGLDVVNQVGNFIAMISNNDNCNIQKVFAVEAKKTDLPFLHMKAHYEYSQIANMMPELLYADHAAFWKYGVPGIFLTDTGSEQRYIYEHSKDDTIDKLNFEFLSKVVYTVEKTILQLYGGE